MNTIPFVWLIGVPLAASPLVYLLGPATRREDGGQSPAARLLALVALLVAFVPFVQAVMTLATTGPAVFRVGSVALRLDGVTLLMAGLGLVLGLLVVLFSNADLAGQLGEEKYYAIMLVMVATMIGLASSADLFNMWIWFEAMAVSSYLLVVFYRDNPPSLEAGVKYMVQSAAGSVLVLIGIALVLGQTGTLALDQIRATAQATPALLGAGALLTIGFGVKTAFVPLHTWLPDAYAEAPSGVSAILSAVITKAGLVALLRGLAALAGVSLSWGLLLIAFAILNIVVGNFLAFRQTQVKRLLAYSSLSQLGYIFLGIGISVWAGEAAGAQGGFFHMITHGLMAGLAFLAAGALIFTLHKAVGENKSLTVSDLAGAAQRYPIAALALSIAVLGLGGLPPLAGFMSKWQIFVAGFETQNLAISLIVAFAAVMSVVSLGYYAPIVNAVYRQQPSLAVQHGQALPASMSLPLLLMALAIVAIGFWPGLVGWLTGPAGSALLASFMGR